MGEARRETPARSRARGGVAAEGAGSKARSLAVSRGLYEGVHCGVDRVAALRVACHPMESAVALPVHSTANHVAAFAANPLISCWVMQESTCDPPGLGVRRRDAGRCLSCVQSLACRMLEEPQNIRPSEQTHFILLDPPQDSVLCHAHEDGDLLVSPSKEAPLSLDAATHVR